jgi:hypothetical protein
MQSHSVNVQKTRVQAKCGLQISNEAGVFIQHPGVKGKHLVPRKVYHF